MLTPQETNKLRLIKQMALRGLAHEVSREDKQWVIDITVREKTLFPAKAAVYAMREGYDLSKATIESATVAV